MMNLLYKDVNHRKQFLRMKKRLDLVYLESNFLHNSPET